MWDPHPLRFANGAQLERSIFEETRYQSSGGAAFPFTRPVNTAQTSVCYSPRPLHSGDYNAQRMKLLLTIVFFAVSTFAQTEHSRGMLDMTFPEFEAAAAKTDVMLLPIGAVEEHGPHLPLASDALGATAQLGEVERYLQARGTQAILGPQLNIGITNEAGDWTRDGTYMY